MRGIGQRWLLLAVLGAVATLWTQGDRLTGQGVAPLYLALGDSLTAGIGASDPDRFGYPPLLLDVFRVAGRNLELSTLARPRETTDSFLGASASAPVAPSQFDRVLALLRTREVALITLSIGANDLWDLTGSGQPCDLTRARTPVELRMALEAPGCRDVVAARLVQTRMHLATILNGLVQAKPATTPLIVLLYYNPFRLGLNPELEAITDATTDQLNTAIREAIGPFSGSTVHLVDLRAAFAGREARLTHASRRDIHPNDLGYRVIAGTVLPSVAGADVGFFAASPAGAASCPDSDRWRLLYWRGVARASIRAVSLFCPEADRFWINRGGRWLAFAPLRQDASDQFDLEPGEFVFSHGQP